MAVLTTADAPKTTLRGGSVSLANQPVQFVLVSHGNNSRMVADQVAAEAFLAAVKQLNPNGRGSVSGREAADFAGLTLTDADLDDLIVHLIRGVPPQLVGHPPLQSGEQWVFCGSRDKGPSIDSDPKSGA
jgi:hypothetical protein